MSPIEWGTRLPNGNVCKWDTMDQASRAHQMSKTFPDGEHPLVCRVVGEWETATEVERASEA